MSQSVIKCVYPTRFISSCCISSWGWSSEPPTSCLPLFSLLQGADVALILVIVLLMYWNPTLRFNRGFIACTISSALYTTCRMTIPDSFLSVRRVRLQCKRGTADINTLAIFSWKKGGNTDQVYLIHDSNCKSNIFILVRHYLHNSKVR